MKIYRLEHKKTGSGFWFQQYEENHDYFYTEQADNINCRCNKYHPNTRDDFGDDVAKKAFNEKWVHGCYTLENFYAWFETDWFVLAQEYNFGLFEYTTDTKYICGKSQVIFDRNFVISKREISIAEYEDALK